MTSVNAGLNPYANYGTAYARTATAAPSLANALGNDGAASSPDAATNLTLSDAARAQLAGADKNLASVISELRAKLSGLYAAAKVTGPLDAGGKLTVDLSTLDRRSLYAMTGTSGGSFTRDEQTVAQAELARRFNAALAPATGTAKLTGDVSGIYQAALDYLDGAGAEEKATAAWAAQRDAVLKGISATRQNPGKVPSGIANDPVAAYLAQPDTAVPVQDFATVAKSVRAALDAQAKAALDAGKGELVYDSRRKTGQLADLSAIDNRSLSAMSLNQDGLFSKEESFAAKQELGARNRSSILAALKQSQSSGNPAQFSLGILNTYSAMSDEERAASNWTPSFRDHAVASYKSTSHILSLLRSS